MGTSGRVARFAVRHRRAVLLVSLALSAASLLSLRALRLDVDVLDTLPKGEPAFDEYKALLETFGGMQTLPILVSGLDRPALGRTIDALADGYRALPEVDAVFAGLDPGNDTPYLDPVHAPALVPADRFPELAARLEPAAIADTLAHLKAFLAVPSGRELTSRVARDPLGLTAVGGKAIAARYADPLATARDRHVFTPAGDAGLILLRPRGSPFDAEFTAALVAALARVEAAVRGADPTRAALRLQYAGAYAHASEDARLIRRDVFRYSVLALIGVIAIFQVGYRNLAILPLVGYSLVAGSLLAFASSVLVYHQLNALSLSFAAIFFGLAIDSDIYFYSRLLEERRRAPLADALARTLDGIGPANIVASTTTAAAFAVIAFSSIAAVRQIGVLTALGMLVNIAHTFLVLPALTATFPGRLREHPPAPPDTPALGALAASVERHPWPSVAIAVLAALACAAGGAAVPVDAEVLHLRPRDSDATRAEDTLAAAFGTLTAEGVVVLTASDLESALLAEERVVAWLEAHRTANTPPTIAGYQALTTILPARATERARRAAFARLPLDAARRAFQDELVRQRFRPAAFADAEGAFTAAATAELPRDRSAPWLAPLFERHVRWTERGVTLALYLTPAPGTGLALVRDRLRADVDSALVVSGRPLMQERLAHVIAREVLIFTVATVALNLLIVLLQQRNLVLSLVVMTPTVVIVLALLAGMRVLGVAFTPINLMVLPLTLGIGVDNCVYLLQRWREGHSLGTAARLVGRPLALTTLTTTAGFGFLAVSRYPGLAGLGWLAATAIALTLLGALLLLPAFLAFVPRPPARR